MFKNILIYTIPPATNLDLLTDDEAAKLAFVPCALSANKSSGWVPPRGQEHGSLIEKVNGQWLMAMLQEVRKVPGDALRRALDEKCQQIEISTGRKPGRKEKRELKEEIHRELLTQVLSTRSKTQLWIDPTARLLCIDGTGGAKVDGVITLLVKSFEGFIMEPVVTQASAGTARATWLMQATATEGSPEGAGTAGADFPDNFAPGKFLELAACDESQARVRFTKHHILTPEVRDHLAHGKVPTQMAIEWDDRVSFVLTDRLGIRKIDIQDVVLESSAKDTGGDEFDANVAIFTGELSKLIPDLVAALGGTTP